MARAAPALIFSVFSDTLFRSLVQPSISPPPKGQKNASRSNWINIVPKLNGQVVAISHRWKFTASSAAGRAAVWTSCEVTLPLVPLGYGRHGPSRLDPVRLIHTMRREIPM